MPAFRYLSLTFTLLGFLGLWTGPAPVQGEVSRTPVEVSFAFRIPSKLPVKGSLLLQSLEQKSDPLRVDISSPAHLSLSLPAGSQWEVSAEVPGFWVRRKALAVAPSDQSSRLTLELWPLGTISGVVRVKGKKAPLPRQVLVHSLAVPSFLKRPAAPKGDVDCPVDKKGAWSCSLPAAAYDLVISAEGLAPHYRWGVQVPAGKTLPLGTIELERGASVAGWVAVEAGTLEPGRCVARLSPLIAGGASLKSTSDLERTAFERQVGKDGFFQLAGLVPGVYVLEVQQPGYPPVRRSPVRVDPGAETRLAEPLVLRRPLPFELEIRPPLDWLEHPWSAQIFRIGESRVSPLVFEGRAGVRLSTLSRRRTQPGLSRPVGCPLGRSGSERNPPPG